MIKTEIASCEDYHNNRTAVNYIILIYDLLHRPKLTLPLINKLRILALIKNENDQAVCYSGLYQIGEVYARSWILAGTSLGRSTPNIFASTVVHRGVGISSTLM